MEFYTISLYIQISPVLGSRIFTKYAIAGVLRHDCNDLKGLYCF